MRIRYGMPLAGRSLEGVQALLRDSGLEYDAGVEFTAVLEENGRAVATASRQANVLKCVAVSSAYQGEGLAATVVSEALKNAVEAGYNHTFVYTKPENQRLFSGLGFYSVAETEDAVFMENHRGGVEKFVAGLRDDSSPAPRGAIVANCNPFTNGHLHLIEQAARRCGTLYVFILSEDRSEFPAGDRLLLARKATAHLDSVKVHPTGEYLVSAATFPEYFIKDKARVSAINYHLDLAVFAQRFCGPLGIGTRFVGEEPYCPVTRGYNAAMLEILPRHGIAVEVLPRKKHGAEAISASAVRALLRRGDWEAVRPLVPACVHDYLLENGTRHVS